MGKINANCLAAIQQFMKSPQRVEIVDTVGNVKQIAILDPSDGVVHVGQKKYDNPSAARADVIGGNRPTYRHFRFNGKLLSDRGVHR